MKSTPSGDKQLADIFLLFAEVHLQRQVREDELAGPINHMLRYDSRQRLPLPVFGAAFGRLEYWYRHVDLIIPVGAHEVALRARLKAHGEYAVCDAFPKADGKARHQQLAELSDLLATRASDVARYNALFDALNRSGGHWDRVLRDWMSSARGTLQQQVLV